MTVKLNISQKQLEQLYGVEEKTIEEVASILQCSPTTIRRRLKEFEIARFAHGPRILVLTPKWSADIAYAVGLIATDGNLSINRYQITLTSSDLEILNNFAGCIRAEFNFDLQIKHTRNCYRIQWGNQFFYNWLLEIGLMPCKSAQLGPIVIQDEYLPDFVRGCLDGDGNINEYVDNREHYKNRTYSYQRLSIRFTSGSRHFLEWLQKVIQQHTKAEGGLYSHKIRSGQSPYWDLKFGKRDSIRILNWVYYTPGIPYLSRKYDRARPYLK